MSRSLKILIKLSKSKLDKILKDLQFQRNAKARVEQEKAELLAEIDSECKRFANSEFGYALDSFLLKSRDLIKRLNSEIDNYSKVIFRLEIDLQNHFAELKKFEIAQEQEDIRLATKSKKIETKQIDELNVIRFGRI